MSKRQCLVYVIDDDASVRTALARLLRSGNCDVETFPSPEEFLAMPHAEENACIVTDLRMPKASGFDLQKQTARGGIHLPIIVLSASDDAKAREHARELGAVAFFRKPVDDQALLDAIWWAVSDVRPRSNGNKKQ
jgi:FixJ family two-component response regulator